MKRFLSVFAVLFCCLAVSFADEFTGFLGIPFGTTKYNCEKELERKGWYIDGFLHGYGRMFNGKQYAGKDIYEICIEYTDDLFSCATIGFKETEDKDTVLDAFIKKYSLEQSDDSSYWKTPDGKYIFFTAREHPWKLRICTKEYYFLAIHSSVESDI